MTDLIPRTYPVLYLLYRLLIRVLFRLFTRVHVSGREHVPREGACLLAANHLTMLDPPLVYGTAPRKLYALAASKYEDKLFFRVTVAIARAVWVRRGEMDRVALRRALAILEAGNALYVSAEGTRSPTGALIEGKPGVAYLATRSGAPVVPVAIWGVEQVEPAVKRWRRADVHIVYGEPFSLPAGRARGAELDEYTDLIMGKLASMLPAQYRGVYAAHPLVPERASKAP